MNWYKKSQNYSKLIEKYKEDLPEIIEEESIKQVIEDYAESKQDLIFLLNLIQKQETDFGFEFYHLYHKNDNGETLVNEEYLVIQIGDEEYIVDNFEFPSLKEAQDYIANLSDMEVYSLVGHLQKNITINDLPEIVYHATTSDRLDKIKKKGLEARCETRGISNRSAGCGVFTSINPETINSYGDTIIEINVEKMRQDGFNIEVEEEEPLQDEELKEIFASKLEVNYIPDEFYSDALSYDTIIFKGNIPPKYLNI